MKRQLDETEKEERAAVNGSLTLWLPPGVVEEPPVDKRRWNAALTVGIKPWTRNIVWCQQHPDTWTLMGASNRADSIAYRLREGVYGAAREGEYTVTTRALGHGISRIYLRCDVPPASVPQGVF